VTAQFKFLSGARVGQVESFRKAYIGLGRHPLSDVRFDAERDLDVSARHAGIVRHGETFVVRDLGSTNGTFVNGARITGEVMLADGDVITFGQTGPAVEFRILSGDGVPDTVSDGTRASADRMSAPREQYPAVSARAPAPPRRSSTAVRIAVEVARQTRHLRRTTKLLIGILVLALAAFTWTQWQTRRDARELAQLQARADSLAGEAQRLLVRFQTELASLRDALRESQAEVAHLRTELAAAGSNGDARAIARLRAELDAAETRQRGLAGAAAMDYRAISLRNQDAVAMVVVQFSDTEIIGGTAFAADSQGTLITNRHVLVGEGGNRRPLRIAVKFSGSRQWFPARLLSVADSADVGAVKVDIHGGTPRVAGFATEPTALARGDPVAIVGYPLGEDLPMEHMGQTGIVADPTLTVGTVSKTLANVVQVDGFGAPGSSGSPIFDRSGRVAAVLYGGNRESQGKIIYAVPAIQVAAYLRTVQGKP
jgi:S1-C subfamily serine protease